MTALFFQFYSDFTRSANLILTLSLKRNGRLVWHTGTQLRLQKTTYRELTVRRQTELRDAAAQWVAEPFDVDPFALPVRYEVRLKGRSSEFVQGVDRIVIGSRSVTVQRTYMGIGLSIKHLPVADFSGVAIRIVPHYGPEGEFIASVNLHHEIERFCLPLHLAFDCDDIGARWQCWSRFLGLPMLLPALDGSWREPFERLGKLRLNAPIPRSASAYLASRRPKLHSFRETGSSDYLYVVDGAEIIARD